MRFRVIIMFAVLLVSASGCAVTRKPYLKPAEFAAPIDANILSAEPMSAMAHAELIYAQGVELESHDSADCVERYLQCAKTLWPVLSTNPVGNYESREAVLYRSAVGKVVEASQRFGLLDHDQQGMQLASGFVPVRRIGFPWHADEVGPITVVGDYDAGKDIRPIRQRGLGVPLLVKITTQRPFVFPDAMYALPVDPNVTVHTLIGTGHGGHFGKEPSDGVVPVSSARHPNAASELHVDAGHGLHHHPDTIKEVVRILHLHAEAAEHRLASIATLEE